MGKTNLMPALMVLVSALVVFWPCMWRALRSTLLLCDVDLLPFRARHFMTELNSDDMAQLRRWPRNRESVSALVTAALHQRLHRWASAAGVPLPVPYGRLVPSMAAMLNHAEAQNATCVVFSVTVRATSKDSPHGYVADMQLSVCEGNSVCDARSRVAFSHGRVHAFKA